MMNHESECLFIGALGRDDNAVTLQKRNHLGIKAKSEYLMLAGLVVVRTTIFDTKNVL